MGRQGKMHSAAYHIEYHPLHETSKYYKSERIPQEPCKHRLNMHICNLRNSRFYRGKCMAHKCPFKRTDMQRNKQPNQCLFCADKMKCTYNCKIGRCSVKAVKYCCYFLDRAHRKSDAYKLFCKYPILEENYEKYVQIKREERELLEKARKRQKKAKEKARIKKLQKQNREG